MLKPCFVAWMASVGLTVLGTNGLFGQNYPNKPIRIVTAEAGGVSDFAARLIAQGLKVSLGQQVIVDNRGATVIVGPMVAKAPSDGYTMLLYGTPLWIEPLLRDNVPWDPLKDFSSISLVSRAPNVLVVHPSVAANSVKELIALAKARPGELNYASGGSGSTLHIASELFKAMASVDIVHIPYKGSGPALNALIAGQVQVMFANAGSGLPFIKSGKMKALAVTSAQPFALLPGLPTVAASGVPGYESGAFTGMFAPANTPAPIINQLHQEIVRVLNESDVKQRFRDHGNEVVGGTPGELTAAIKSDVATTGKVIKDAGIRAN